MNILKGSITAPRWTGTQRFLKEICFITGAELNLDVDKGWLTETCFYTIKGTPQTLDIIRTQIQDAIDEYNDK